jgi:hypothetical protein
MGTTWSETELPVNDAVAVVLLASAVGGAVGHLFTVHLVASELEAVWLTTVSFAAVALYATAAVRS